MKRAAIVLHVDRPTAVECGRWLARVFLDSGVEVFASNDDAPRLKDAAAVAALNEHFDVMVALGGDGTFLRAAELAAFSATPLLGVNLGRIGFLTEVEQGDLERAIRKMVGEGVTVTRRMTLEGELIWHEKVMKRFWALNDICVSKLEPGRLIRLGVSIGGEPLTAFAADGVIVATPTGSTAYSFSAGGPIVSPDIEAIVVTPVSPHLIFDRSVLVPATQEIEIHVLRDPDAAAVCADGRGWVEAPPGSIIRLTRSDRPLLVADVDRVPFWRLVRTKFHLPELPPEPPEE